MINEVTEDYVKNEDFEVYDLDNEEDLNKIEDELELKSMFFKPEINVVYKIKLTDSKMIPVSRDFKDKITNEMKTIYKRSLNIHAIDKDKNEFTGVWEVGSKTFRKIFEIIKADKTKKCTEIVFKLRKTGTGLETDYDIMTDDF